MLSYQELVDRNWGLIPQQLQQKVRRCNLLLVGCGLASQAAQLAARTGFMHFTLFDGDSIEGHNLNRQGFAHTQIGSNKAEATAQSLRAINPKIRVEAVPQYLSKSAEIESYVSSADIIINSADPTPAMYHINRVAQETNSLSLFPLNLGFMGYVLAFTEESEPLEKILGEKICGLEFYLRLLENTVELPEHLEHFLREEWESVFKGERAWPQLALTTYDNARLITAVALRWLNGDSIPVAPTPVVSQDRSSFG